jgi:hypothetical protein
MAAAAALAPALPRFFFGAASRGASACWLGSPEVDVSGMIAVSSFIAQL